MIPMSPTEEIRAIRHALAARFDNDLSRIFADLQRQECESGLTYVTLPKREPISVQVGDRVEPELANVGASN